MLAQTSVRRKFSESIANTPRLRLTLDYADQHAADLAATEAIESEHRANELRLIEKDMKPSTIWLVHDQAAFPLHAIARGWSTVSASITASL